MITDGQSYYGLLDGTKPQTFPNPTDNYVTFGALTRALARYFAFKFAFTFALIQELTVSAFCARFI
jgi:hypothetical protein